MGTTGVSFGNAATAASVNTSGGISLSGLSSGLNWKTLVTELINVERAPEQALQTQQQNIQRRNNAYGSIQTELQVLQNNVNALNDPTLFDSRTSNVSDSTSASVAASAGAPVGSYAFNFTQLASAASQRGTSHAGATLNSTNDVSSLVLSNAGFTNAITAGTITVNGQQVQVATTDTLQGLFDKISSATGGTVTGSYDSTTDKISLNSSSGQIILGSATDSSNFLQSAQLLNNGTSSVTSSTALGGVRLSGSMASSNMSVALTDGGSGNGAFSINGVTINYNASTDSVQNVLDRINNSTAGVSAAYDATNNRFTLTNDSTGDVGMALKDVTGNFLAATGLTGGTLQRGSNLLYTVNGGGQLVSQSNTIGSASSGIAGLQVTALKQGGSATVNIGVDSTKIQTAVTGFVSEYNTIQSLIDSQNAVTKDSSGNTVAGILTGDAQANGISGSLRSLSFGNITSLGGAIKGLSDLGIQTSGLDNSLTVSDTAQLTSAITSHLADLKSFFTDPANGFATKLNTFINATVGDGGTLITSQTNLTNQSKQIDVQVADMERLLSQRQTELTNEFVQMETAQSTISNQLKYLQSNGL
jgi:flagellar hook-associated protein 2